jgi:hypothetical protein
MIDSHMMWQVVKLLLFEACADATLRDKQGRTPEELAAHKGHTSCVHMMQVWYVYSV